MAEMVINASQEPCGTKILAWKCEKMILFLLSASTSCFSVEMEDCNK